MPLRHGAFSLMWFFMRFAVFAVLQKVHGAKAEAPVLVTVRQPEKATKARMPAPEAV